jgi:hypothetical protein
MRTSFIGAYYVSAGHACGARTERHRQLRRLGEDRRNRNIWLASPESAQNVVT